MNILLTIVSEYLAETEESILSLKMTRVHLCSDTTAGI